MGMRAPEETEPGPPPPPIGPSYTSALVLALILFVALVANGRPIGAGDTRPTERLAASLVAERDLDLDEYPEVRDPFARTVGDHRVSIYPVLSAVLAVPVFAAAGALFPLDELGTALAGKLAAALLSSLAAALLFLAVGRRWPERQARWTAVLFALGTSVWSSSQALWQHPAAVLFLSWALLWILRAEDEDSVWAGRAGLPLSLAVAARHADVLLVAVLAVALAVRHRRQGPWIAAWGAPGVLFVMLYQWAYFGSPLSHGFSSSLRFSAPWGVGHLGLLVSPGKGLLVFTPLVLIAMVGLVRAFRYGERWLSTSLGLAAAAHWLLMGRWLEWHGGECWGPRMLTDLLPLLLFFLPEGLQLLPRLGAALAVVSVAVQVLGAFSYDYRWERLHQRPPSEDHAELWRVRDGPILFHARQRVVILAQPWLHRDRLVIREHRFVPLGATGTHIAVAGGGLAVRGDQPLLSDIHLLRGARVEGGRIQLRRRWDGLFLRVRRPARARPFELRLVGRGNGPLYVGEGSFWSPARYETHMVSGAFDIRHTFYYPDSGGPELTITVGKGRGEIDLSAVSLVAPGAE